MSDTPSALDTQVCPVSNDDSMSSWMQYLTLLGAPNPISRLCPSRRMTLRSRPVYAVNVQWPGEKEELSSLSTPILECLFSWAQHGQIGRLPRNTTLAAPLGAKEPFHVYNTALIFWLDDASPILLFGEWVFFLKSSLGQIGGIILDHSDSGNTQERTCKKLLLSDLISKNCWGWTVIKLNGRPQCIHSPNKPHLLPYKSDIFPDGEAVTFERNNCP